MEREALKLALEALENMCDTQSNPDRRNFPTIHDYGKARLACIAIKAALAQPAQEPVACERCKQLEGQAYDLLGQLKVANLKWSVAHPWVGLTDEEIKEIVGPYGDMPIKGYTRKLFDQIEAKLRSKNNG
jgi:hypothetical protein